MIDGDSSYHPLRRLNLFDSRDKPGSVIEVFDMLRIATVGYERANIETFLDTLLLAGIQQIIDVRELPLSRKHGFSKRGLTDYLLDAGIGYVHLRSLGDPKPGREAAKLGDYQTFRRIFSRHMQTKDAQGGLETAAQLAREKHSALLCFERHHTVCHRSIVADALRLDYGFAIEHLLVTEEAEVSGGVVDRRNRCTCQGSAPGRGATR